MYSRIATLWEIRNVDDLDPVVKLLVESLASEVFALSGELDNIENRVVDKLVRTFTPSSLMAASPAHAVMHARSISGSTVINATTEFSYKEPRFLQRYNLRKMLLTPVCSTKIFDADTVGLIQDGRFYTINPRGGSEHIANSTGDSAVFNNAIWIGLQVGKDVKSLKEMAFFFEFPFMDDFEEYLGLIEYSRWSHNDREISVMHGLENKLDKENKNLFGQYNQNHFLNKEIKAKYDKHFVTIKDELPINELKKESVPHELQSLFSADFLQSQCDDVIWVKVELPPSFSRNGMPNLAVHVNCFPVANMYSKQIVHPTAPTSGIIRLDKGPYEYFLFLDSVSDSSGSEYKQVSTHDDTDSRSYVLRRGGSECFSSIDARDFLDRLLDLYRNESIAFSGIDKNIASTTENMTDFLSNFDKKLQRYDDDTEQTSYIIPGADMRERTNLIVQYQLTNGTIANGIKAPELFTVPDSSDIVMASAILMTTTRGGRKSPPASRQKDLFQYMLMSNDRIYTQEDIKLFCRSHYGEYFKDVEVKCGYEVSDKPKEGMIRVTKVTLHGIREKAGIESNFLAQEILAGLERRSPDGLHYRIILN